MTMEVRDAAVRLRTDSLSLSVMTSSVVAIGRLKTIPTAIPQYADNNLDLLTTNQSPVEGQQRQSDVGSSSWWPLSFLASLARCFGVTSLKKVGAVALLGTGRLLTRCRVCRIRHPCRDECRSWRMHLCMFRLHRTAAVVCLTLHPGSRSHRSPPQ